MALWGKTDAAASAPKFTGLASNGAIANALFNQATTGVFGVDAAEGQAARGDGKGGAGQGWILQQYGTGGIVSLVIAAGGSGYVNNEVVTFSNGFTNATATLGTNATGGVTSVTITANGTGFANTGQIVIQVANSTAASNSTNGNTSAGSSLDLTITLGGRAGRVNRENLVALTAYPNNDSEDVQYPDS